MVEIARIAKVIQRWDTKFLERIYTAMELLYCRGRVPELAVRFAGKEAISKALGTGIRGLQWRDMEILPDVLGKPTVTLHGGALARAQQIGLTQFAISLSHSRDSAVAMVVAT